MKVKELEETLKTIKDKEMDVITSYYSEGINGYYFSERDGKPQLVLTNLEVQPRTTS